MEHMTHNYMLGLATLVISFVILFYLPIGYFWVKAVQAKKRNQNKSWGLKESVEQEQNFYRQNLILLSQIKRIVGISTLWDV